MAKLTKSETILLRNFHDCCISLGEQVFIAEQTDIIDYYETNKHKEDKTKKYVEFDFKRDTNYLQTIYFIESLNLEGSAVLEFYKENSSTPNWLIEINDNTYKFKLQIIENPVTVTEHIRNARKLTLIVNLKHILKGSQIIITE